MVVEDLSGTNGQGGGVVRAPETQRSQRSQKTRKWRWRRNHRRVVVEVEVALVKDVYV